MASGLGAIILVLIIVKQDVAQTPPQADLLHADLSSLEQQDTRLKKKLADMHQDALAEVAQTAKIQAKIATLKARLAQQSESLSQQQMALSAIKDSIKQAPAAHKNDVVNTDRGGEEHYVMGLKVTGRKIVLLIDSSASMTDEKLIAIIKRKNSSDSAKKNGPKWQRSKRIARWLLARAPATSMLAVVAYNNKARKLGTAGWINSRDAGAIKRLYSDLNQLVPSGATNLQRGLQAVKKLRPSDIYLVTDGLPTAGQSRFSRLNPFSSCGGLLGRSNTISGACRVKLFRQTLAESAPDRGVKVNVILLPIEGDPQASPQYWAWTAATGGLLISPARSWP